MKYRLKPPPLLDAERLTDLASVGRVVSLAGGSGATVVTTFPDGEVASVTIPSADPVAAPWEIAQGQYLARKSDGSMKVWNAAEFEAKYEAVP